MAKLESVDPSSNAIVPKQNKKPSTENTHCSGKKKIKTEAKKQPPKKSLTVRKARSMEMRDVATDEFPDFDGTVLSEPNPNVVTANNCIDLVIKNISQKNGIIYSPTQIIYGMVFTLCVHTFRGNDFKLRNNLCVSLNCVTDDVTPRPFLLRFILMRRSNRQAAFVQRVFCHFSAQSPEGIVIPLISRHCLYDQANEFVWCDTVRIRAEVAIDMLPDLSQFAGLRNQGATCYMNSLLQVMFFTNRLRKTLYHFGGQQHRFIRSLQLTFFRMQTHRRGISAVQVIQSFGPNSQDLFAQNDVEEFIRLFLERIECELHGSEFEGVVPRLFQGTMESFVRCKHIDYESRRAEIFYDLQLNVKDLAGLDESLRQYTALETLDGANQYAAGEHGLQDAVKGVRFKTLPPVLHLHLQRAAFDAAKGKSVKCIDAFRFGIDLDMSEYLESGSDELAQYKLQAVLVHSGQNDMGHYLVYINTDLAGDWHRFDDDVVTRATAEEAIDQNFGGQTCAYMLVYIKVSEVGYVLDAVGIGDVPLDVIEGVDANIEEEGEETAQAEVQQTKLCRFDWLAPDLKDKRPLDLVLPANGTVLDAMAAACQLVGGAVLNTNLVRMVHIANCQIVQVIPAQVALRNLTLLKGKLRLEAIPVDQRVLLPHQMLVAVMRFHGDLGRSHGEPFFVVANDHEFILDIVIRCGGMLSLSRHVVDSLEVMLLSSDPCGMRYLRHFDTFDMAEFAGMSLGLDFATVPDDEMDTTD